MTNYDRPPATRRRKSALRTAGLAKRRGERTAARFPSDELASTRLSPQHRDEGHVVRPGLIGLLPEVLRHRLTVVHAGAGYGKTSLLMQWLKALRHQHISAAWLTLEEEESAPAVCLAHIIAALNKLGYIDYDPLSSLGRFDGKLSINTLATVFINTVADREQPLVILLDDYNRAQSQDLEALLRAVVRNLPQHVHFVIASRWRPDIDLETLRARGELLELSARELRFSTQEVAALLTESGAQLDDLELHRLTDRTEGWPIALQMARLWLNGDGKRAHLVADFSGRTTDLARYLSEQVLSALPVPTQQFLMQTAILDRVNGDIADAITGRRDGWLMLEDLYERDLFLIPENDERQWFRYHTLFLDFLRDRLQRRDAHSIPELHHRAADWLAAHGPIKAALHHALEAHDHALAARLLTDAGGWRLIMDGRMALIRTAIAGLPADVTRSHLTLSLARTVLLIKDGDVRAAREYFDELDRENKPRTAHEQTELQIIRHMLADYADEPVTEADIERLQSLRLRISRHDHVIQAVLADSLATRYYEFGHFQQSLDACDDAISRYRVLGSFYGEVFLRFTQAKARLAKAQLDDAEGILRGTMKELELRFGEGVDLSAHASIYLAEVLVERCVVEDAAACLAGALSFAEQSDGWYELYAAAYTAAAAIGWVKNGPEAAHAALERARAVARSRGLDRLAVLADCESVYYLCLAGRSAETGEQAARLWQYITSAASQPVHRLVGAASSRLAMIHIAEGRCSEAEQLLAPCIEAADSSGDLRQLIGLTLLLADAQATAGQTDAAARTLDKAVHQGLFSGLRRPYIDLCHRLKPVIERILREESQLSPDRYRDGFLRGLLRDIRRCDTHVVRDGIALTPVELEVLNELDCGYSNKEIARRLGVSPNTIKYRIKSLFAKLHVSLRSDAVRVARERSLLAGNGLQIH